MAIIKTFERKLDDLWSRRTRDVRAVIGLKAKGREKAWTPAIRRKGITELIDLTSQVLLRPVKKEVRRIIHGKALKRLSGRGDQGRFENMIKWAKNIKGPIIYTFWRGKKCLYVGKGGDWTRLMHYRKVSYLRDADKIQIYCVRGRSQLPKAECLMIHLLTPRDNKQKAARVKWGKACPICRQHDFLRKELKVLFD